MTDFRALCEELADELTQFNTWYIEDNGYGLPNLEALLRRCDAALAQPEPQGPTDEELVKHYDRAVTSAIAIRVAVRNLTNEDRDAAIVVGLRAVLTRWGNHPAKPDSSRLHGANQ